MKRLGISLITLVITIVVVIIIAGAVILNLSDNNPIKGATQAVVLENIDTFRTELMLKLTSDFIFDTENINAVTKDDIIKYIPSMEGKKVGSTLYTDILVVSEGNLKVDGTKANEEIEAGKLTQEQYDWIVEALGNNVFNAQTYIVKYYMNDGTENYTQSSKIHNVKYSILANSTDRENYGFIGWNTSADGTGTTYSAGDEYTENAELTLYAQWKVNTFTITYYKNDGTEEAKTAIKNADVAYQVSNQDFTRTGYTFEGWNTKQDGTGTDYAVGASYTENAEFKLYAKWKKITYTVTYNANNGTGAPSAQTKEYGTTLTLSTAEPTRTGYTFDGWNTNAGGTGTNYALGASYTANENITLYAKWKKITYTVTYNANNGAGAPSAQTKEYGTALTLSTVRPTRTGYTFDGWNTNAGGTGTNYALGASYTANADLTLYAKWKKITYTVTYNANNGTGAPSAQTKEYGTALTLSTTRPTRTGYTFLGWNTNASGTGTNYALGANYTANGNLTLYAKWQIGASAAEVKASPANYYGAYVNYTPSNGCSVRWRVFYADSSRIYLVAEDFVPNSYLTSAGFTKLDNTQYNYKDYCITPTSSRSDLVSRLTRSSYYTSFKDSAGKAYSVVGSPTLELFKNSYNQVNGTNTSNQISIQSCTAGQSVTGMTAVTADGYVIRFGNSSSYRYYIRIPNDANKRDLYVSSSTNRAYVWWLASISAYNAGDMVSVYTSSGYVGSDFDNYDYAGLRPLVTLNTGVKLVDSDGDGIYNLQ